MADTYTLSHSDFLRLKDLIYSHCGIQLNETKKTMMEGRLQKRLKKLGMASFSCYCDYLFSKEGMEEELPFMTNEITTNKTDFFREPAHFEYLTRYALPELMKWEAFTPRKPLRIWSAGCSSGEEPYTLAMVLQDFSRSHTTGLPFTVLATDISSAMLEKAKLAVYEEEKIAPVPPSFKKEYLLRSADKTRKLVRIVPELRSRVAFMRLNFMDRDYGLAQTSDIIFCRNVIIYFDKKTQERLLNRFCQFLSPYGYIFMGHSETILGMDVSLVQVAPTVYRKCS
jgi:chemotaxis protein methyltransferase CheR